MRDTAPGAPGCEGCAFNIIFLYKLSDGGEADEWKYSSSSTPDRLMKSCGAHFQPQALLVQRPKPSADATHCRVLHPAAS